MAGATRQPWFAGYIRVSATGRKTYVIDRWIGGVHFHRSTRCSTEWAAHKQLERFEADPVGYRPAKEEAPGVSITTELVREYREWMLAVKGNTPDWVSCVVRFLGDWADDLGGRDLRCVSVQADLKPALDRRKTSRPHRIEAIKAFCTWLRTEKGLLTKAEDRTLDLPVPVSTAAKNRRRRVVTAEHVRLVLPHLSAETRDVLVLQGGTAWHISEVRRFAEGGELLHQSSGGHLAVLVTRHKSGELTRTPIGTQEHLDAAARIRKRGRIPAKETLVEHMRDACNAVRARQVADGKGDGELLPHFRLGVMRHSVLTWAVEMGATATQASEFAGHRSLTTTKKFYLDLAVPTVSIPVVRLT